MDDPGNRAESNEQAKPTHDSPEDDESSLIVERLDVSAPHPLSLILISITNHTHNLSRLAPPAVQASLARLTVFWRTSVAPHLSRRWLARGVAMTMTLGLILALFGAYIVPGWRANFPSGGAHANGYTVAGNVSLTGFGGNDWGPVATADYAQTVAFNATSPITAYSCAVPGIRNLRGVVHSAPVVVSVSHDGGQSWAQQPTHIIALLCNLSVDPTNPRDVILIATTCLDCFAPSLVFRSFDGAHTWRQMNPPVVRSMPGVGLTFWGSVACCGVWMAHTYYLVSYLEDTTLPRIAASANGGAFHLLNANAVRAALTQQGPNATSAILDPFWVLAQGSTLFMRSTVASGCANGCLFQARSTDGGNTWRPFAPTYSGQPVRLISAVPDGGTLVGQVASADDDTPLLRSTDGGAHWRAYPLFPVGMGSEQIFATPDGALFAWLEPTTVVQTSLPAGVYELPPNVPAWSMVAPAPPGPLIAVSWDAIGNAQALWANLRTSGSQRLVGAEVYRLS